MFEKLKEITAEARAKKVESDLAMLHMMADLTYPVTEDGSVVDMTYFGPIIAWHLVRCGWRPNNDKRLIKPRRLTARGVVEGAVEWVGIDEPDDPIAHWRTMTMADINALPKHHRAEVMRRMGQPETPDLKPNPGWKVRTRLKIQDAPDISDGIAWSGRTTGGR